MPRFILASLYFSSQHAYFYNNPTCNYATSEMR